ncbi:hypothetical protein [Vibrio tarriae]|uniref:hypothetical protein n=1 Tax=Vibrio tarriae TaxID=2014742 RepID=UPI000DE501F0|nr:hypothetical protein [Vibrio tarriae]RBM54062.1 hypothetical protein DLR64_05480 [Vibrio tarriae]
MITISQSELEFIIQSFFMAFIAAFVCYDVAKFLLVLFIDYLTARFSAKSSTDLTTDSVDN